MRIASMLTLAVLVAACDRSSAPSAEDAAPADTSTAAAPRDVWPDSGPVDYRRERSYDLTGDGTPETVRAVAQGPRYDSLDVAITITGARGDTLWHETWPSLLYFKYDAREGKQDSTVMRIVRSHVDSLLADDRFTQRGPPARLTQGGSAGEMMNEAVRYHLAELDWRGAADLTPADATPPEGHSRIRAENVVPERVAVVVRELQDRPSFWYYAGGEAVYAIAWSEREHAFVRIYSCC